MALVATTVAGCGDGNGPPARHADGGARIVHGDGVRYVLPGGWRAARRSLTPHLLNPREVLTVGTGQLAAGGGCAQFPSAALRAMRPADALVTVQERLGSPHAFPAPGALHAARR